MAAKKKSLFRELPFFRRFSVGADLRLDIFYKWDLQLHIFYRISGFAFSIKWAPCILCAHVLLATRFLFNRTVSLAPHVRSIVYQPASVLFSLMVCQPAKMQKRMDQQAKKKELEDLRYTCSTWCQTKGCAG